jgi:alkanesulfonate monooxygenase SsuD/methylene tetrahydromethanopterin reductase-like flavin-dependent oxidoreductase (luciferase family)
MPQRLAAFITPGKELGAAVERARLAEKLGYEAVFSTQIAQRDGLMTLAAYAAGTSTIRLGTGVIPAFPRHPVALAYEVATLDEMSGGRLIVGIGTSHRINMETWYGADMTRPLSQLKEYLAILRQIVTTGRAQFEGSYYKVNFAFAGYGARPDLPIYLSGLSPNTLRFAGEAADGVILWSCMPSYIREVVVPNVRAGEHAAGRSEGACEIVAAVPCGLAEDLAGARNAFRREFFIYMTLPFYRKAIEGAGFADDVARFDVALSGGDSDGARAAISDSMLEHFAGIGSAAEVRAKIAEYRAAGVTLPAVGAIPVPREIGPGPEATLEAAIG